MPYRVDRLLALLLSMLLALSAGPVVSATERGPVTSPSCGDCCAYAPGGNPCTAVSVCAPALTAEATDDESPAKPLGAWCAGILRAAYIAASTRSWALVPASGALGPPFYLSFGHFLL